MQIKSSTHFRSLKIYILNL